MGITVERVMSDNGSCYRSAIHAKACRELGIRHLRTQPYRPRTNGKAEGSSKPCRTAGSTERPTRTQPNAPAALPGWLTHYNYTRRHGSLGHKPPAARLAELQEARPG